MTRRSKRDGSRAHCASHHDPEHLAIESWVNLEARAAIKHRHKMEDLAAEDYVGQKNSASGDELFS